MRKVARIGRAVVIAYVVVAVMSFVVSAGVTYLLRGIYGDPRVELVAGVENLRFVDGHVWAGGQPDAKGYRRLAELGVTAVVDLRTGASDDDREDDPRVLDELDIRYHRLPIKDGHTPHARQLRRFSAIVRSTPGIVFVHCGSGVGRTAVVEAGYTARRGRDTSLTRLLSFGPITLAQAWFIVDAEIGAPNETNAVVRRASELLDAPRRLASRLRALA